MSIAQQKVRTFALLYWVLRVSTPTSSNTCRKFTLMVRTFAIFRTHNSNCREMKGSLIKQMLIYVCCLSVVLCHRLIYLLYLSLSPFPECSGAPLGEGRGFYCFKICLLSTFSSTVICWIAIWLSFWRRSPCGRPSLIKTALRFSMLLKQINWLIVA